LKLLQISFKENGKLIVDKAIIGEDITEEQAQGLIGMGIAKIIEVDFEHD
jgi:hypothetical protein